MPGGINGWDLVEHARTLLPEIPVLLCSGYALEALASHGRLPPDVVLLNKPYSKTVLARRLREAIDR
jgi:two-component SAPR family response regulator